MHPLLWALLQPTVKSLPGHRMLLSFLGNAFIIPDGFSLIFLFSDYRFSIIFSIINPVLLRGVLKRKKIIKDEWCSTALFFHILIALAVRKAVEPRK